MRIGIGYDSHRFDSSRPLVLGGVRIDNSAGLAGHSDGDALLHAITDAILGAAALGDIGSHFPDTDEQWRNADSAIFLKSAADIAFASNYTIGNIDAVVVCEQPRLQPHILPMRKRIAEILEIDANQVSIKGKTNEGMGAIGKGEGLAAICTVILEPLSPET